MARPYDPLMCGRFTLVRLGDFLDDFPWVLPPADVPAGGGDGRYNIAPTQPIAAVFGTPPGPHVEFVKWGLVPSWARDATGGGKLINARAETLAERPAFRKLVATRRCLVPADGFYEWKPAETAKGFKQPYYVRLASGRPFALAGLWDVWHDRDAGTRLTTCTIITAEPNAVVAALHNRMAVIVRPDDYRRWLDPGPLASDTLAGILRPYPAEAMTAVPVSTAVNNVRADGPDLTRPAGPPAVAQPTLF